MGAGEIREMANRSGFDNFPGCSIRLSSWSGVIKHENFNSGLTTPTIRSYPNGIKVGGTFVTNEALEQIYQWQQDFLGGKKEKTWQ